MVAGWANGCRQDGRRDIFGEGAEMAEGTTAGKKTGRRIDPHTWIYLLVFLGLLGSVAWFEWFDGKLEQVNQLFAGELVEEYPLPDFSADREGYAAETREQLERLDRLEAREPEVSYAQRIMDWEERVTLVEQLHQNSLTAEDYRDSLISKLYSLVNLTETRNLRSREMMLKAIEDYRHHPYDEARKLVLIGDVEIGFIDCLKTPEASAEPALERTDELLRAFPQDETVATFLDGQAVMLVSRKKHDVAAEVLRRMYESFHDSTVPGVAELAKLIPDRIRFVEIRFDEALERMRSSQEGADAFFLDCLAKLAADPTAGPLALRQLLEAATYYEQTGRFLNAQDVYQLLDRKMSGNQDPLIASSAKEAAKRGVARMESLGREVPLRGYLPDGREVTSESLRGKFVVLYFWWEQMPEESCQVAIELNSVVRNYRDSGVVFFGIGADADTPQQAEATFNKVPNWHLQLDQHLATVGRWEQELGIPRAPYVTVLDKEGKISAINVAAPQLKSQLDQLLGRRPSRVPFPRSSGNRPARSGQK